MFPCLQSISNGYSQVKCKYLIFVHHCRAIQEEATHHQVLHTGEAVVPMGITPQVHTLVQHVHQEVLMALMVPQVREGSMGMDQGVPPAGLMGVMGDSLMEDRMDTMLQEVTIGCSCVSFCSWELNRHILNTRRLQISLKSPSSLRLSTFPSPSLSGGMMDRK